MRKLNSSFWLDDRYDSGSVQSEPSSTKELSELIKLASVKKAISNFVTIVTNESIPVQFNERGDSYTDGKSVVISGSIKKDKDFDVMVGLALHEGSHIKLSDFDILRKLDSMIPDSVKDKAKSKGVNEYLSIVKNLTNYVEDRRIDQFIFDESPGYRDYYRAMYDKYFNDRLIDKTVLSNEYTDESIESYMFRIINLHNSNTSLKKLNGLRDIYKTINLGDISRLKSSSDAFMVALAVFEIILNNLPDPSEQKSSDSKDGDGDESNEESTSSNSTSTQNSGTESDDDSDGGMNGSGTSLGDSGSGDSSDGDSDDEGDEETDGNGDSDDDDSDGDSDGSGNSDNGVHRDESKDLDEEAPELTERQKGLIEKKIKKQEKFLDGDVRKTTLSKKDLEVLTELSQSGTEMVTVGNDIKDRWGYDVPKGLDVIVVHKLTEDMLTSEHFPLASKYQVEGNYDAPYQKQVDEGIRKGRALAKKLQVRSEERTTIFNRQKNGKIDKRMLSSLGFGNENVFHYKDVDSFSDLNLHISIDASSSMSGDKWKDTMVNVVSLIQAIDIIQNLQVQVTFRATSGKNPYIVKAYDSREDKISKVKKIFPYLRSRGTTPEGLTFEAIMKNFVPRSQNRDSFFLNISDGEPYFPHNKIYYSGEVAVNHTRKQVNNIRQKGIKVLSYFVGYSSESTQDDFKKMYGRGAEFINVSNIKEISRTMNRFFLEK